MREVLILYKHTQKKENTIKMHRFFAILLKEKSTQKKEKSSKSFHCLNMTRQTTRHKDK